MGPAGQTSAIFVTRSEAAALDTELFRDFLTVWLAVKDGFGLPYPGSWMEQPWPVCYALTLFERLHGLERQQAAATEPSPGGTPREKQLGARGRRFRPRRGR